MHAPMKLVLILIVVVGIQNIFLPLLCEHFSHSRSHNVLYCCSGSHSHYFHQKQGIAGSQKQSWGWYLASELFTAVIVGTSRTCQSVQVCHSRVLVGAPLNSNCSSCYRTGLIPAQQTSCLILISNQSRKFSISHPLSGFMFAELLNQYQKKNLPVHNGWMFTSKFWRSFTFHCSRDSTCPPAPCLTQLASWRTQTESSPWSSSQDLPAEQREVSVPPRTAHPFLAHYPVPPRKSPQSYYLRICK